jgi:uncharacterized protein YhjY with autotransporter beta-barrel domain
MSKRTSHSYPHVGADAFAPAHSIERARGALLAGTALGVSVLVLAAAPETAFAANECGALTTSGTVDSITCHTGSFPSGITYVDPTGNDLTVVLAGTSITTSTNIGLIVGNTGATGNVSLSNTGNVNITGIGDGIDAYSTHGSVTINLTGTGSIKATSATTKSYGVLVNAGTTGAVSITGNVSSYSGANAYAVDVKTVGDNSVLLSGAVTAVSSGSVSGSGKAFGVYDKSTAGNVTVNVGGLITVEGRTAAYGVRVVDLTTDAVHVTVGNETISATSASGHNSAGVSVNSKGAVTVTAGDITTSGNGVGGVTVTGSGVAGVADITVGEVSTIGASAYGVYAKETGAFKSGTVGNITITSGDITTTGAYATGIRAKSSYGDITVTSGSVVTTGARASGISLSGYYGDRTVTSDYISTSGKLANGIVATTSYAPYTGGPGGNVVINSGTIITHGYGSYGILARAANDIEITSSYIHTSGDFGRGIFAYAKYGNVTINSDVIKTDGVNKYAQGIEAKSNAGSVTINSDYVSTQGNLRSNAIYGWAGAHDVTINSGVAITHGDLSTAILARSIYGNVYINSGEVLTAGEYSTGIFAETLQYAQVNSQYVETTGYHAYGITVIGGGTRFQNGNYFTRYEGYVGADVISGTVITTGDHSTGIFAITPYGSTVVEAGYTKTSGVYSPAIYADSLLETDVSSGSVVTTGDHSPGITAKSTLYGVRVASGDVITSGAYSPGIVAGGYYFAYVTSTGAVTTSGANSGGIQAFALDNGAYGYAGYVSVTSNIVTTSGVNSPGITAFASFGDIGIVSNAVYTAGDNSPGIVAQTQYGGDIFVESNTVVTQGANSPGIVATSPYGAVSVSSGFVETSGANSPAIYAYGGAGVSVSSGVAITAGDHAPGIVALSPFYGVSVASGDVITSGAYSPGIVALAFEDASVNSTGLVSTAGDHSTGIVAESIGYAASVSSADVSTSGAYSPGIVALAYQDASVNSTGLVSTSGLNSAGIVAESVGYVASVASADVTTSGAYSPGILAVGYLGASVSSTGVVSTSGRYSPGIEAFAAGGVSVVSNAVETHGAYSPGIEAVSQIAGDVSVVSGAVMTHQAYSPGIVAAAYNGAVNVVSGDVTTIGFGSSAIVAQTAYAGDVTVVNDGSLYAARGAGVDVDSAGAATIVNYDEMFGAWGTVVGGAANGLTLDNAGVIYGFVDITSGGTRVNNAGVWNAYGASGFGGGAVFNNTGHVVVTPFATAATATVWSGIGAFNNSGLVDLRNGHTGDVFSLTGAAWTGSAGSTLAVDVSLNGQLSSDKLVVGAASGSTTLSIHDLAASQNGVLNIAGTTVVKANSGSASAFSWAGERKGFVDYSLSFNSSAVTWNIVGLPDKAAFEMLKAPALAQSFWQRSGDAWTGREQEVRDSQLIKGAAKRGDGWEAWAQAETGSESQDRVETFSIGGASFSPDLSTRSRWDGFQAGADKLTSGNVLVGVTAGYLEQRSNFKADTNSFDLTGWNFGAYAGWTNGVVFANGLVKADAFNVQARLNSVGAADTSNGDTYGAKGELGMRLATGQLWVEPIMDLAWTSTHLSDANFVVQGADFRFSDATSLRGSVGARIGGQVGSLLPYLGVYWGDEFRGDNHMTMLTGLSQACGAACVSLQDLKPGAFTRVDFGFSSATAWKGVDWYLKGETESGAKTSGTTGRFGVRWRW